MFCEQLANKTASRWLARAVGKRREAKPTLGGPTERSEGGVQQTNFIHQNANQDHNEEDNGLDINRHWFNRPFYTAYPRFMADICRGRALGTAFFILGQNKKIYNEIVKKLCGYRIVVLPDPSKIVTGVRLPLPAPNFR